MKVGRSPVKRGKKVLAEATPEVVAKVEAGCLAPSHAREGHYHALKQAIPEPEALAGYPATFRRVPVVPEPS
jgi:hypothetical protein